MSPKFITVYDNSIIDKLHQLGAIYYHTNSEGMACFAFSAEIFEKLTFVERQKVVCTSMLYG